MSPILASLALLALYWQPSAGLSWKMETQNLVSLISKEQQSQVGASLKAQSGGKLALFNLMPNTMIMTGLETAGAMDKVLFMKPSFVNGALCELDDPSLPEKLMRLSAGEQTAEQLIQRMAVEIKKNFNVDCAENPPTVEFKDISPLVLQKVHKCFCADKKGAVCLTSVGKFALEAASEEQGEAVKANPCLNETVPALLKAGSGVLGRQYDLQNAGQNAINDAISGNVDAFSNDQMMNLLCDAVNPDVEAAVKAVYASDGLYWFTETLLYAMILGNNHNSEKTVEMTMLQYCELEAVKADAYGRCFCQANEEGQGTGFTFCIYKVIAEFFVNEGYLTCDKADSTKQKFIAERKPRAIPQLGTPKANATAVPANSTVGPASIGAPTGGAATSSLTIASLAAAALLLINH